MIKRLRQACSKLLFCLRAARGPRSFFQLVINSKRFNRYQQAGLATNLQKDAAPVTYKLSCKNKRCTISLRTYAGDIRMFYEIFLEEVYRLPAWPATTGVIIDAGANIGMAGLYFSILNPKAVVYCIEPAAGNYKLLEKNLALQINNGQVKPFQLALSAANGMTGINENETGWAYNAALHSRSVQKIRTVTMENFFTEQQLDTVELLKMDIEGEEENIFKSDTEWLRNVKMILIEIHAANAVAPIQTKLLQAGFSWSPWQGSESSGQVYFASRVSPEIGNTIHPVSD